MLNNLRVAAGMGDENTLRARAEQIVVQIVRVGRDAAGERTAVLLVHQHLTVTHDNLRVQLQHTAH